MGYVYIRSEPGLFTVGFFDPTGKWHADSDHDGHDSAAERVAYLNGSATAPAPTLLYRAELPGKLGLWLDECGRYYRLKDSP